MRTRLLISMLVILSLFLIGGNNTKIVLPQKAPVTPTISYTVPKTSEHRIVKSLKFLNVPEDKHKMLVRCVKTATYSTGFDEELIVALMSTESEFNTRAISPKRYKGLMQTPKATFKYPEVDTLYGVKILEDKLEETNGNLMKALALYKGGNNSKARKYAMETWRLYQQLLNNNKY